MFNERVCLPARRWWWTGPCMSPGSWGWTPPLDCLWMEECRPKPNRWCSDTHTHTLSLASKHARPNQTSGFSVTFGECVDVCSPLPYRLWSTWVKSSRQQGVAMTTVRTTLPWRRLNRCGCHVIMWLINEFLFVSVVKTTVLLADMNDFTNVNDVYKQCEWSWSITLVATALQTYCCASSWKDWTILLSWPTRWRCCSTNNCPSMYGRCVYVALQKNMEFYSVTGTTASRQRASPSGYIFIHGFPLLSYASSDIYSSIVCNFKYR